MNKNSFQKEPVIAGDSAEDTDLLRAMAVEAKQYLLGFKWCPPIEQLFLAYGIGGVVAVFYVEFSRPIDGGDNALWVVVGDLPSAYLVTDELSNPREVLESYCQLMEGWISAVLSSGSLDEVFPVAAAPKRENAEQLTTRVRFLRESIIPNTPGI